MSILSLYVSRLAREATEQVRRARVAVACAIDPTPRQSRFDELAGADVEGMSRLPYVPGTEIYARDRASRFDELAPALSSQSIREVMEQAERDNAAELERFAAAEQGTLEPRMQTAAPIVWGPGAPEWAKGAGPTNRGPAHREPKHIDLADLTTDGKVPEGWERRRGPRR